MRSPIQVAAINARKTHCVHGHEFTTTSTVNGKQRICRTCRDDARLRKAAA